MPIIFGAFFLHFSLCLHYSFGLVWLSVGLMEKFTIPFNICDVLRDIVISMKWMAHTRSSNGKTHEHEWLKCSMKRGRRKKKYIAKVNAQNVWHPKNIQLCCCCYCRWAPIECNFSKTKFYNNILCCFHHRHNFAFVCVRFSDYVIFVIWNGWQKIFKKWQIKFIHFYYKLQTIYFFGLWLCHYALIMWLTTHSSSSFFTLLFIVVWFRLFHSRSMTLRFSQPENSSE